MHQKSMHKKNQSQKGFSVIEVVVSLLIFGLVLLIYNAAINTIALSKNAKYQQIAYRIANTEIESLRATAFASLPSSGSINDPLLSTLPHGAEALTVTSYDTRTKQINVVVTWTEPEGSAGRTVSLSTLITKGGLGQ